MGLRDFYRPLPEPMTEEGLGVLIGPPRAGRTGPAWRMLTQDAGSERQDPLRTLATGPRS